MPSLGDIPERIDFRNRGVRGGFNTSRHKHERSLIHGNGTGSGCKLHSHRAVIFGKQVSQHISSRTGVDDDNEPFLGVIIHTNAYTALQGFLICAVVVRRNHAILHQNRVRHHGVTDFVKAHLLIVFKVLIRLQEAGMGYAKRISIRGFLIDFSNRRALKHRCPYPRVSNIHGRNKLVCECALGTREYVFLNATVSSVVIGKSQLKINRLTAAVKERDMNHFVRAGSIFQIPLFCSDFTPVISIVGLCAVYDFTVDFLHFTIVTIHHTDKFVHLPVKAVKLLRLRKGIKLRRQRRYFGDTVSALTAAIHVLNIVVIAHLRCVYRATVSRLTSLFRFFAAVMTMITLRNRRTGVAGIAGVTGITRVVIKIVRHILILSLEQLHK